MQFNFSDKMNAFQMASSVASELQLTPPEDVLLAMHHVPLVRTPESCMMATHARHMPSSTHVVVMHVACLIFSVFGQYMRGCKDVSNSDCSSQEVPQIRTLDSYPMAQEYSKEAIMEVLDLLTPDAVRILWASRSFQVHNASPVYTIATPLVFEKHAIYTCTFQST